MYEELELFKSLISSAESLTYENGGKLDYLRDRAFMILTNIFGEDNNYTNKLYNIHFEYKRSKNDKIACKEIWTRGREELIDLFQIALEEYESFKIINKEYADLFYTVTKYLAEQDNSIDKTIALLLNYADFDINESTQFSDRYNCAWAEAIIRLPSKIVNKFTVEMGKRLTTVLNEFRPSQWSIDFSGVTIEPKLEKTYDNWRDDILKQLTGEGINNQASFKSSNHPMFEYKGIKFRSKSEMALAPMFESSEVLFFPLPIAVCGNEHKEPDFLVCKNGKWAILEVVTDYFHPSVEKEADRTNWFLNHHVPLRQYTAKNCYNQPKIIIGDFLKWMDGLGK